jgi:hypothetical protein
MGDGLRPTAYLPPRPFGPRSAVQKDVVLNSDYVSGHSLAADGSRTCVPKR